MGNDRDIELRELAEKVEDALTECIEANAKNARLVASVQAAEAAGAELVIENRRLAAERDGALAERNEALDDLVPMCAMRDRAVVALRGVAAARDRAEAVCKAREPAPDKLDALLEAAGKPWGYLANESIVPCSLRTVANVYAKSQEGSADDRCYKTVVSLADFLAAHIAGKEPKPAPERTCDTCRHSDVPARGLCALRAAGRPNACGPDYHDWQPIPSAPEPPKCAQCGEAVHHPVNADGTLICERCWAERAAARRVEALRRDLKPGMCVQHKDGRQASVWEVTATSVLVPSNRIGSCEFWKFSDIAGTLTLKGESDGN